MIMIKKYIGFLIILLMAIIIMTVSTIKVYATNETKSEFATVASNNVTPGGTSNITINLKNINYKSFNISINSDDKIEEPTFKNGNNGEQIENEMKENTENTENTTSELNSSNSINNTNNVQNNEQNEKSFTISNISNLDSIIVSIPVSKEIQIGSKITITITITDTSNSKNSMSTQISLNVAKEENTVNNNNQTANNLNNIQQSSNSNTTTKQVSSTQQIQSTGVSTTLQQGSTKTITYNGSDDNYLTNLSINGEKIENFNKTNTTYFKTLQNGTDRVDISYNLSDLNSTVCIYGNTNLKVGLNKVLVAVTSENGTVKNYRIYVTVEK